MDGQEIDDIVPFVHYDYAITATSWDDLAVMTAFALKFHSQVAMNKAAVKTTALLSFPQTATDPDLMTAVVRETTVSIVLGKQMKPLRADRDILLRLCSIKVEFSPQWSNTSAYWCGSIRVKQGRPA